MDGSRKSILSIRNLNKHYGGVHALIDVSLDLYRGEQLFIVGDNGAGKSSFVNVLAGIILPDEGSELYYEGERMRLKTPRDAMNYGISTVFQDLSLCNNLNAYQNIFLGRELQKRGRMNMPQMKHKTHKLFEDIGSNVPNPGAPAGTRSGGQRQALTLLMSTMVPPKILLLDEHTAALDPGTAEKVLKITREVVAEHKITTMMVTHNMHQALELGNRTLMMDSGRIVLDVQGEERSSMTVNDLLERFKARVGEDLDNDRILLS